MSEFTMTPMKQPEVTTSSLAHHMTPKVGDRINIQGITNAIVVAVDVENQCMTLSIPGVQTDIQWDLNSDWTLLSPNEQALIPEDVPIELGLDNGMQGIEDIIATYSNTSPGSKINGNGVPFSTEEEKIVPPSPPRRSMNSYLEILSREIGGRHELTLAALTMKMNAVMSHAESGKPIPNAALLSLMAACQLMIDYQTR